MTVTTNKITVTALKINALHEIILNLAQTSTSLVTPLIGATETSFTELQQDYELAILPVYKEHIGVQLKQVQKELEKLCAGFDEYDDFNAQSWTLSLP